MAATDSSNIGTNIIINVQLVEVASKSTGPAGEGVAVGLVLVFVLAFGLNATLTSTIASSYLLKRVPFHRIILALAIAHLLETAFNLGVSIVFAAAERWRMGPTVCTIHSCVFTAVPVLFLLLLTFGLGDRAIAVRKAALYNKKVTVAGRSLAAFAMWLLAAMTVIPIAANAVNSRPFIARYACCPTGTRTGYDIGYAIAFPILAYVMAFAFAIPAAVYLAVILVKDRRASKDNAGQMAHSDRVLRQPALWGELQLARVALAAFMLFVFFQLPSAINISVDQGTTDHPYPRVKRPIVVDDGNVTSENTTEEIRQEVMDSPTRDTAFVWLRYIESVLFPIIVFILRKDVREKALVLLVFWKPHPTADASPRNNAYLTRRGFGGGGSLQTVDTKKKKRNKKKQLAHVATPVLFATSEGLYLRTPDDSTKRAPRSSGGFKFWQESTPLGSTNGAEGSQFVCHVCDVWEAYDDIEDLEEAPEETEVDVAGNNGNEDTLKRTLDEAAVYDFRRTENESEDEYEEEEEEVVEVRDAQVSTRDHEDLNKDSTDDSGVADSDDDAEVEKRRRRSVRFSQQVEQIPRSADEAEAEQDSPTEPDQESTTTSPPETSDNNPEVRPPTAPKNYRRNPIVRPLGSMAHGVSSRVLQRRKEENKHFRPAWNSNTRVTSNAWRNSPTPRRSRKNNHRVFPGGNDSIA